MPGIHQLINRLLIFSDSQKSKTLCSGSFYNDIFLLLINKPVVLEKKGNGGKNT